MKFEPLDPALNEITGQIVDAAYQVHSNLGPGLMESVYEKCLSVELKERELNVQTQVQIPILYKQYSLDANLRLDMLVENSVIVELKSVEQMLPVFEAQLLTYLRLSGKRLGLLINFNVPLIKKGIKRIVL